MFSFLSFARSTKRSTLPPSAAIWFSISITAWFAPPCSGPHSAPIPAEMHAKMFAIELPTRRTVLVEQFCSWSACRMNSRSTAFAITGSTSYSSHGVANIIRRKFAE